MSPLKQYVDKVTRVYERYIEYVKRNPSAAAQVEGTVRTLSYLIAGQWHSFYSDESYIKTL